MLNQLKGNIGARKKRKCLGRGIASGKGKTCGRGGKGQTARSGVALNGFEGGQMPIYRRLPKRGFNPINKQAYKIINLYQINYLIKNQKLTQDIKLEDIEKLGLFNSKKEKLKLLGKGVFEQKFNIEVNNASKKLIENASKNGSAITLV
ncbi:50S ribosomal protein L15 [Candidatus Bandiella numerosa]|jgi:large subunit ribosomal protein L15|uniref:50S ribosomal protein L15 n=1 Tax=Candidatus Bandiella numerosa TaxID=2570586 RepID=UPI00249E411C|nr:50S ribosomal protein L15 [Candidatus Bandiella numerosa]WHA05332.1 50S ribosomal protein L15 [Candidatus Bandiella numerosa]